MKVCHSIFSRYGYFDYCFSENDSDREEEDDSISELELAKLREKTRQAETEDEEFEKAFRSVLMVCANNIDFCTHIIMFC